MSPHAVFKQLADVWVSMLVPFGTPLKRMMVPPFRMKRGMQACPQYRKNSGPPPPPHAQAAGLGSRTKFPCYPPPPSFPATAFV